MARFGDWTEIRRYQIASPSDNYSCNFSQKIRLRRRYDCNARSERRYYAMVVEPATHISEELAALISRAELASENARRLLSENDRWRQSVQQQLDYMFEIGAEFRRPGRITYP